MTIMSIVINHEELTEFLFTDKMGTIESIEVTWDNISSGWRFTVEGDVEAPDSAPKS